MATSGLGVPFNTTPTSGVGGAFAGMNNGSAANFGLGTPTVSAGGSGSVGNSIGSGGYIPESSLGSTENNGFLGTTSGSSLFGNGSGSFNYNTEGANIFGLDPTSSTYQWLSSHNSSLTDTYGKDSGSVLGQFVQSGAGFNQEALNQLFDSMAPQEYKQLSTIANQQGTQGTRFSSANDFANADYMAQVNATQTQAEFNEYNQAIQNMMSILMGSKNVPQQNNTSQLIESGVSMALSMLS
jgi:hypothetical protein